MPKAVNLLPLSNVVDTCEARMLRDKEIYQLRNNGDDTYDIGPFSMLVYNGSLRNYLKENGIRLCYIVDDDEIELKQLFVGLIETYYIKENGEMTLHQMIGPTKRR